MNLLSRYSRNAVIWVSSKVQKEFSFQADDAFAAPLVLKKSKRDGDYFPSVSAFASFLTFFSVDRYPTVGQYID